MSEWFYTKADAAQEGPVDEATLLELNREGVISARTLVWAEGSEEWVHFADVAASLFGETEEGIPREIGICAFSNQVCPVEEMLPYGEALIAADHKEAFVQELLETGSVEIEDATEKRFEYMGFWWRTLSSLLDYLIKMIPSWICMIPYYVVFFTVGEEQLSNGDPEVGALIAMGVSYGVGGLGILAVSIFYETWMVGKHGGTLGKIIIGARVVNPDGSKLTYKRAFVRWLLKKPFNYLILFGPSTLGFAAVVGAMAAAADQGSQSGALVGLAVFSGLFVYAGLLVVCSGIYWMAAFDSQKRALHDRMGSTRVIRKPS